MGRFGDFAHIWYIDSKNHSAECPYCGMKTSYRKEDLSPSGTLSCEHCGSLFRVSK